MPVCATCLREQQAQQDKKQNRIRIRVRSERPVRCMEFTYKRSLQGNDQRGRGRSDECGGTERVTSISSPSGVSAQDNSSFDPFKGHAFSATKEGIRLHQLG